MKDQQLLFSFLVLIGLLMSMLAYVEKAQVVENNSLEVSSFESVRPIFQNRCAKCHVGNTDWTDYEKAYAKRVEIRKRVWTIRNMPLTGSMPEDERIQIRNWIDQGAKQ